jgi:hypothetical protein
MHKVTLLVAENKELRQANEILSRRRRQKKIRLQKRGAMTVEEASQVIDQIDVNTQVQAETSRSGGRGRSVGPGVRRCGVCGETGHNARTCQEDIQASGDKYSE